ncbi:hypothetical protein BKA67DRAFT_430856 [Truncatella angustata]|uniref:J domain-containing protein n=1 Tax=Truncatella angustata TaxID=152316 RepID=A0A9P8RJZ4_9PEZI|nr:uncharacterized protein BKA67DRAFT_430856 [Truncatella angustata]KAH6647262.1 hypothetical protein BKA67DRAFT_430856 [Truncatella angustata]
MADAQELLAFAKDYSSKNIDLYQLLDIDSLKATDANEVKRAYRKVSIKYHPDKLGDKFDPEKWQLLERGRDVLMDKPARDAYDAARSATLREQERRKTMNAKRQAAIDDLEARERGEDPKRQRREENSGINAAERQSLYEQGARRMEMRKRELAAAEERERLNKPHQESMESVSARQPQPKLHQQTPPVPASPSVQNDEDDPEIAALQKRIREAQEKKAAKAARKADKAARKGGEQVPPIVPGPQAQETPIKNPITTTTEPQADTKKVFSFTTPATTATTSTAPKSDWASIKERLKTAQAEREKRKAEQAASTAA